MRWALVMMRLCAACRNTSVRRITGTAPDEMTSASTWPGPTDGSWSMSPTIKRAALSGTAFMSACISMTSTMEASSTARRSQPSGLSLPRLKPPVLGLTSSSRWMVLASKPVASVMRLAARPVGAHSKSFAPFAERMRTIALTRVVLADARPTGDDQDLGGERQHDCRSLAFGKYQAGTPLNPRDRLVRIDPRPGQLAIPKLQQPVGDAALRPVQACQENAGSIAHPVGNNR